MSEISLRHGIFLPPFHPNEEDPTQCLERDLDLMVWLDKLGFHEAWIGEHHSAGYEIISSPRSSSPSRRSAPGTSGSAPGVVSLALPPPDDDRRPHRSARPYDPRAGHVRCGPGLLAGDAIMMGIDPMIQRDRMAEALDAILRLFKGEIVTEKTDWYTMEGARLHLLPYTKPYPEVAVVSSNTPSGGRSPASTISA